MRKLLAHGVVPVVSPLARGAFGETLNVNADSLASAIAIAMRAEALVLLTDVDGVFDARGERCLTIDRERLEHLIDAGVVHDGMIPKLRAAIHAAEHGVAEVRVLSSRPGILSQALTDARVGTRICRTESSATFRLPRGANVSA